MPSKAAGWALLALVLVQGAAAQAPAAEAPITAVPAGGFSQVRGRTVRAPGTGAPRAGGSPVAAAVAAGPHAPAQEGCNGWLLLRLPAASQAAA